MIALSVTADEAYTGTVSEARIRLDAYDNMQTTEDKVKLLDSVLEYLLTVDPEAEGYNDLVALIDEKELSAANEYLGLLQPL